MAKNLPVPPELEHLIEKRDEDTDRRKQEPRSKLESQAGKAASKPEQPQSSDRRRKRRRKTDS